MGILTGVRNDRHLIRKLSISLVIGLAIAICGSMPYYRPDLVVGGRFDVLFKVTGAMFMVGLLVAALLSGNVHNASLAIGVVVNWLLYSLSLFVILKRKKNKDVS
jgi:hypothetical protein